MMRAISLSLILMTSNALADVVEVRSERMVAPGEVLSVIAQCAPGMVRTGGGYALEHMQPGKVLVISSLPTPNETWTAAVLATQPASETASLVRMVVSVVCLKK